MRSKLFLFGAVVVGVAACSYSKDKAPEAATAVQPTRESIQRDFVAGTCLRCHRTPTELNRFVDLNDIGKLTEAGHHRPAAVIPGCPKQSLFLSILREGKMPPLAAEPIPETTLKAIEDWIVSLRPDAGDSCNGDEPGSGGDGDEPGT
jgi:hypothetical protein